RRLVITGAARQRKTFLLVVLIPGGFPGIYIPSVIGNQAARVQFDALSLELGLWDTSGHGDYDMIRPLTYSATDVLLMCFSVGSAEEKEKVIRKWMLGVRRFCPDVPMVLVGIKPEGRNSVHSDLDLASERWQGLDLAKIIGALTYIQCNLENNKCVGDVVQAVSFSSLFSLAVDNT
ncbi:RhoRHOGAPGDPALF4 complex, partial [Zopfia rhizophila CBS 207.26]